jgi:hypothetical protein
VVTRGSQSALPSPLREKVDRPKAETDEGFSRTWRMRRQPLIRPSGSFSLKGRRNPDCT